MWNAPVAGARYEIMARGRALFPRRLRGIGRHAAIAIVAVAAALGAGAPASAQQENEQRNILFQSAELDGSLWSTVNGAAILADVEDPKAPDGSQTADKLVRATDPSNNYRVQQRFTATSGQIYTLSTHVRAGEIIWVSLTFGGSRFPVNSAAWFNTRDGLMGTVRNGLIGATIEAVGEGWFRIQATAMAQENGPATALIILAPEDNTFPWSPGNNTDGVFLWGAQLEIAPLASEYQPTGSP